MVGIDFDKFLAFLKDNPAAGWIILGLIALNIVMLWVNRGNAETKAYTNAIDQQARSYNSLDHDRTALQKQVRELEAERDGLREQNKELMIERARNQVILGANEESLKKLQEEFRQCRAEHDGDIPVLNAGD